MQPARSRLASPAHARVVAAIDELVAEAGEMLSPTLVRDLQASQARLTEARFNLVVLGELKRGKSALINALLERDVLPTGMVPLTSAVTVLRHGPRSRLVVRYQDGREAEHAISELQRFATERENPHNRLGVDSTIVEDPAGLLAAGVQLVDTPGIGSLDARSTSLAWDSLPHVDAAVCMLTADQPFAEAEREFFLAAAARVPRLLVVVNKIDHLRRGERYVAIEFIEGVSAQLCRACEMECYAVSARDGEGIARLAERIKTLAAQERHTPLARSICALAASAAAGAAQSIRFEASAIELPLDELRRRAQLFDERVGYLRAATAQASDLLHSGVQRVLDERVNEPLIACASAQPDELRGQLADHVAARGRVSARELGPALDAWIDDEVRERLGELVPGLEQSVADDVDDLQRRFARRIEEILIDVQHVAGEVFGSPANTRLPEVARSQPPRLSFKLAEVASKLDHLVPRERRTMPGALGRRILVRDVEARLPQTVDRHAGRLHCAVVQRVGEAVAEYQRSLSAAIDHAIRAIELAVERAFIKQRAGEHALRTSGEALALRGPARRSARGTLDARRHDKSRDQHRRAAAASVFDLGSTGMIVWALAAIPLDGCLVVHHRERRGRACPWLPGGQVHQRECLTDALRNGVQAEVGLAVRQEQLLYLAEAVVADDARNLYAIFVARPLEPLLPADGLDLLRIAKRPLRELNPPIGEELLSAARSGWSSAPRWLGAIESASRGGTPLPRG